MLNHIICGNFHQEEEEELHSTPSSTPRSKSRSLSSSPRKSRGRSFCKRHSKSSENPYSSRGLDKFSALLADLEEKRQEIESQLGSKSDDVYFIRFSFSNTNDCKPIVVKLKTEGGKTRVDDSKDKHITSATTQALEKSAPIEGPVVTQEVKQLERAESCKKKMKKAVNSGVFRWPHYYLPVILIMILLVLVFGRSVTIMCTTIGWYMIPTLKERSTGNRSTKKKEYMRKISDNKMLSEELYSPRKSSKF